jgi:hypothetical protein
MAHVRVQMKTAAQWVQTHLLTTENLWALVLCLVIILVIIFTADQAPQWIYQGF